MQAVNPTDSRTSVGVNGKEYAQVSAKTDGMSKGPATQGNGGSDGGIFGTLKRGGSEFAQMSAKTDGLCK
jgi:hypothetical protein